MMPYLMMTICHSEVPKPTPVFFKLTIDRLQLTIDTTGGENGFYLDFHP